MVVSQDKMMQETAVFDVCDTLYYSNTTHDFVRFVIGRSPPSFRKLLYRVVNSRILPFRYALIFFGIRLKYDIMKSFNVRMLKGHTHIELDILARDFVKEYLSARKISETHEILIQQKNKSQRLVLCSSSIEPVVNAVAEELEIIDFAATTLAYNNDIFTGNILADITEIKLDRLKELGLAHNIVFAASDNITDLELLSAAQQAVVIIHGRRKANFWRRHSFKTITLNQ